MRLYKSIQFRLSKKDTPLVLTERLRHAFKASGEDYQHIKIYASDMPNGSVSGIDRMVKQNSLLLPYRHAVETTLGLEQRLTNLPARWNGANPDGFTDSLSMDDVIEIASGIPRRYPLNGLTFIFDKLPILSRASNDFEEEPVPFVAKGDVRYTRLFSPSITGWSDYPSPCIRLQSDWWISGRNNFLDAIIELGEAGEAIPQFELSPGEHHFLSSIGDIYHERVFAAPSSAEEAETIYANIITGEQIILSADELVNNFAGGPYPVSLNPLTNDDTAREPLSVKKSILSHFKKRGFEYQTKYSNGGVYTISKKTENHNLVKLTFSHGKFDTDISCEGSIEGPLWMHKFNVPSTSIHNRMRLNRITRQSDLDRHMGTIAAAYDAVENPIVGTIDDLYGAAPSWLTYL